MLEQYRFFVFIGVLVSMACLEALIPKKNRVHKRRQRWTTNLSLIVIDSICLKILVPVTAVITADFAVDNGWGLLSYSPIPLPLWAELILGIVLMDLAIYVQHVASHKINFLWKIHQVHHADRDIDVTTGIRFHPVEVIFSMLYKCVVILLLGPLTLSVILFEIILNASAMFNHANLKLNKKLDSIIRQVFVTPDMHRVHHSVIHHETDSNYGFFMSIWDRLFRTYVAQPKHGHEKMTIGLSQFQDERPSNIVWSLSIPFRKNKNANKNGVKNE